MDRSRRRRHRSKQCGRSHRHLDPDREKGHRDRDRFVPWSDLAVLAVVRGMAAVKKCPGARVWLALLATLVCGFGTRGFCDVPVSASMLNPATAAEAWNVIGMA